MTMNIPHAIELNDRNDAMTLEEMNDISSMSGFKVVVDKISYYLKHSVIAKHRNFPSKKRSVEYDRDNVIRLMGNAAVSHPKFPQLVLEALHDFTDSGYKLTVKLDEKNLTTEISW